MNPKGSRYYTYIKPFLKNKTVQTYSSLVFSIVTITFFSLFAIKPTLSTIVGLQKSIAEHKQLLEQVENKGETLSLGRKNYDAINQELKDELVSLMPNSTQLPNFLEILSLLTNDAEASGSGIQFQPIELVGTPSQISKAALIKEIDFSFNIQGSFEQVTNTLNQLSRQRRLINIQSVNFNQSEESALVMTINAKTYFFKN